MESNDQAKDVRWKIGQWTGITIIITYSEWTNYSDA